VTTAGRMCMGDSWRTFDPILEFCTRQRSDPQPDKCEQSHGNLLLL
jgi:hypothetical protein